MNKTVKCFVLASITGLSACVSSPKLTTEEMIEVQVPLICKDKTECDLYWQRAQVWIVNNSKFKIQSTTDTVITTYGPMAHDPGMAYTITKIPDGQGGAQIMIQGGCGNMFGCIPRGENAALSFKRYVSGLNNAPTSIPTTSSARKVNQ